MGRFVLRSETDTENPILARFYGDGITAGQVLLYEKLGGRTIFLCLIGQGARFPGDTGCAGVRRVVYAGFDIPEFDSTGGRNWRFHKGHLSKHPVYRRVSLSDSGNIVVDFGTTLVNDQKVAFHKRGASMIIPPEVHEDRAYFVINKHTNDYQISDTLGGAAITFSVPSSGAEIFAYRADDAGLFDIDQGRPEFFPGLDFTCSGKAYIEIRLPTELSTGEDEPTRTKLICRGKEVYDFVVNGTDGFLDPTGSPIDLEDPALIGWDILRNDLKAPRDRFNGASWLAWKNRNAGMINWIGGNTNPASPPSFPTISGLTYLNAILTSTSPTNTYGKATTAAFTVRNASIEGVYQGGLLHLGFSTDSAGTTVTHGIYCRADNHSLYFYDGTPTEADNLGDIYPTDRIKIAFVDGVFKVYRNNIAVPLTGITVPDQPTGNLYETIHIGTLGQLFSDIRVLPSGSSSTPRQVRRFWGDLAAASLLPVSVAFEGLISICPGVAWQDVDGEITILPDPNRAPVFTFYYDPNSSIESNTAYSKLIKRLTDETPNYWRFSYRNKDDLILAKNYANADRPARRAAIGGRKIETGGIQTFGVLTPSQMDRIGESIARIVADLDFGFNIDAFLDSLIVAKGDYVWVVDPVGGFPDGLPSKQMILNETFEMTDDVEKRSFDMQAIVPDWYSDTAHGAVVPVTSTIHSDQFIPAPYLTALTLTEDSRRLPDGTYIPIIDGNATFNNSMFGQSGRVFIKKYLGDGLIITSDGIDLFTFATPSLSHFANDDTIMLLALTPTTGLLPEPFTIEDKLFIINLDSILGTFQLSRTLGGAVIDILNVESGEIRLFAYSAWLDTGVRISPDQATMQAGFEIDNIPRGYHLVRVMTVSPGGISRNFLLQKTARIFISGDIVIPDPPTNLEYLYDGINILWRWHASQSPSVAGYIAKDEFGNLLYQGDARSFVMPARTSSFAVRVFSYSYSSVVSVGYATAIFSPPPLSNWMNVSGAAILRNGILKKIAATGWNNAGAILDYAILSNQVRARLTYVPDSISQDKVFGFSLNPNANNYTEFDWAIRLQDDGTLWAVWQDSGTQLFEIGIYEVDDRIGITFAKPTSIGANGVIRISRFRHAGAEIHEQILFYFPELLQRYPLYAGVALYAIDSIISPSLELTGDLIPVIGIIPAFHNLIHDTYNATIGEFIATSDAVAGGSSVDSIPASQDGSFIFRNSTIGGFFIGLNSDDLDADPTSIPFAVELNAAHEAHIWSYGVHVDMLIAAYTTSDIWSMARENGTIMLRKNGHLEYQYSGSGALFNLPLILDISSDGHGGVISDIRYHPASITTIDPDGDNAPVSAVRFDAQLARNNVYDIPKFGLINPLPGQILALDDSLHVINDVLPVSHEVTISIITGSLANNATENGVVNIGRAFTLKKIISNHYAEIRFYGDAAARTADVSRPFGDRSFVGTQSRYIVGFLLDAITGLIFKCSPPEIGVNSDDPTSAAIYYSVKNLSGSTAVISLVLKVLISEI